MKSRVEPRSGWTGPSGGDRFAPRTLWNPWAVARRELEAGHVVCIFAEGAISRTGNLRHSNARAEKIGGKVWTRR